MGYMCAEKLPYLLVKKVTHLLKVLYLQKKWLIYMEMLDSSPPLVLTQNFFSYNNPVN